MSDQRYSRSTQIPTRPASLTADLTQSADGIAITTRQSRGGGSGFLLLWLIGELNAFLNLDESDAENEVATTRLSESPVTSTRLTSANVRDEAPEDSRWLCDEGPTTVEFYQRGRLKILTVLGLLFINAFWNGIVSVFVMALWGILPFDNGLPQGIEWWGMFVFLIPFEVIGLAMFAGLVLALAEPFRQTTWNVDLQQITHIIPWPVFRRMRVYECDAIDRLELRRNEDDEDRQKVRSTWTAWMDNGIFDITFVDEHNTDVCAIEGLTEGEARWMAGQMIECHPWMELNSVHCLEQVQ